MFKCIWFHPDGVRVDMKSAITDVKHRLKLLLDSEPFVMAHRASQVYYTSYALSRLSDRWAFYSIKARNIYDVPEANLDLEIDVNDDIYQDDGMEAVTADMQMNADMVEDDDDFIIGGEEDGVIIEDVDEDSFIVEDEEE